jgi:hypothetical protein
MDSPGEAGLSIFYERVSLQRPAGDGGSGRPGGRPLRIHMAPGDGRNVAAGPPGDRRGSPLQIETTPRFIEKLSANPVGATLAVARTFVPRPPQGHSEPVRTLVWESVLRRGRYRICKRVRTGKTDCHVAALLAMTRGGRRWTGIRAAQGAAPTRKTTVRPTP